MPPMAEHPLPGSRLLHGVPCRRNKSSAFAAAGCRRWWPCCATAAMHPPGWRWRATDSGARSAGLGKIAVRHERADAQAAVVGLLDPVAGRAGDIDQPDRPLDILFHQVERLVPPAMNFAAGSAASGARLRRRRRHGIAERVHGAPSPIPACPSPPRLQRRCWIGPAPADIAAHQLADFVGGARLPLVDQADRRNRSGRACSSRTGRRRDR